MMMAKVIVVQVISMLGYDMLFQDVDIVWYSNPLDYFHSQTGASADYDIFFQDDGGHSVRYAPYSANSGFYYVSVCVFDYCTNGTVWINPLTLILSFFLAQPK
jgi:hypothetical protein